MRRRWWVRKLPSPGAATSRHPKSRGHVLTGECRQPTVPKPARSPNRALRRAPTRCWRLAMPRPLPSHSRTPRRPGSAAARAAARLSRMTRDWGRAVHPACAASSRLGRARCPRPPLPRPGKRGAVGQLRSHEPVRERHPTSILCLRRAVGFAGAIGAWVAARDEAQCAPTDPGTRRARPGGGLCPVNSRTLCASQRCSSRIAFDARLVRGSGARVSRRASPSSLSPRPPQPDNPAGNPRGSPLVNLAGCPRRNQADSPRGSPRPSRAGNPPPSPAHNPRVGPRSSLQHSPRLSPVHSPRANPLLSPARSPAGAPAGNPAGSQPCSPRHNPAGSPRLSPACSPRASPLHSPVGNPARSRARSRAGSQAHSRVGSPRASQLCSPPRNPAGNPPPSPARSPRASPAGSPVGSQRRSPQAPLVSPLGSPALFLRCSQFRRRLACPQPSLLHFPRRVLQLDPRRGRRRLP